MYQWNHLDDKDIKGIGVDFDNTLAHNSGYPNYTPTEPIEGAVEVLNKLVKRGYKIWIYSARPSADEHNIEGWCLEYKIPFRRIICGKLLIRVLIDDKAMHFTSWKQVEKDVEKFL